MKAKSLLVAASLVAALSVNAGETVNVSNLPGPVQRAIDNTGNRSSLKEVTKDTVNGQVVYDVEFEKNNAINPRLRILEDGTVLQGDAASRTSAAVGGAAAAAGATVGRAADRTASAVGNAVDSGADTLSRAGDATENRLERAATNAANSMDQNAELAATMSALPTAVRNAIDQHSKGRAVADIDQETQDGRTVYEVEFSDPGINPQIHVAADGTLVKSEKSGLRGLFSGTQLSDTPEAVQATVKRELGSTEIVDIDREIRTGSPVYEVEFKDSTGNRQIHVAEDGTVVKDDRVD